MRPIGLASKKNELLKILIYCGIIKPSDLRGDMLNRGEYKTLDEMLALYHALDALTEERKTQGKVRFVCKKGCCDCCSGYFYISKLEYFAIKHYLHSGQIDILPYIQKSKIFSEKLSLLNPDENNKLSSGKSSFDKAYDDRSMNRYEPCPFLKNNQCSVYPVRPIICRLYGISYSFATCDKVLKKCMKLFDGKTVSDELILKHMIDLPYSDELSIGIDYIQTGVSTIHFARPYPLFWWLCNDDKYEGEYALFVSNGD